MTVSPVRRWIGALAAAAWVVALMASSSDAFAQDPESQTIKPIQLLSPQQLAPPSGASPEPVPAPAAATPAASTPFGGGVQVGNLRSIDPDSAGTLTAEQGGFGADMWRGTDRALVERLLPQLPVNSSSVVMRDLMRRMLLSIARVPEGKSSGVSLVVIRVKLLAAMGDPVAVNTLLNATPGRSTNAELTRIETETRFLANDNARACVLAGGQIRDQSDPFWQKVFFFCQAMAGEHDKAALGISVMRESGEKDEVFFSLLDSLGTGTPPVLTTLASPSPLHLAMARVAKAKLPSDVLSSNRPGVLRTIAISPNAPVELRLEAAERAESAGAIPVDSLRQLYSSVSFSETHLANPLSRAEFEGGPMTRALLYHTSLIQTVPTAQAEVVARALDLGRKEGRYASVVRVFLPVLKRIPPSAELLWFAPEAVRGLLLAGEKLSAEAWFALMRVSALFNKEVVKTIARLMPIVRLMGSSEADEWNTSKLSSWWETVKERKTATEDAVLLYSLFDALGEPVPEASWKKLVTGKNRQTVNRPNLALWLRLLSATEAAGKAEPDKKMAETSSQIASAAAVDDAIVVSGQAAAAGLSSSSGSSGAAQRRSRIGETVLLTLLALGPDGPAGAEPLLLRQALISLLAAGFEDEARAMAVEAALAAGL